MGKAETPSRIVTAIFRLHPFSLRELDPAARKDDLDLLLRFGGFPEPLFRQDESEHRIWQRDRLTRVVRDDLRDLEQVREISLLEHLVDLLPERVGSPLSIKSLVASQLLKYCHYLEDTEGHTMELRFLRDTDRRELDFVVLQNRKLLFAVECKTGERTLSPAISYFAKRTPIPRFFQVHLGERHFETGPATVLPFRKFCQQTHMP